MKAQRILCIGAGRMAKAIVSGLVNNPHAHVERITVANRSNQSALVALREQYGVHTTSIWQREVPTSDVILLAMPPAGHPAVLRELAPLVRGQLVITVAAGISVTFLENALPTRTPVAWVMPNTAADIGESISLFTCGTHVTEEQHKVLEMILSGIGQFEECTESQIHELTAITGSAPAFIYRLAGALEQMCVEYGVTDQTARRLVGQMIYGSARMLQQGLKPADLADQVTTPGGATEAGLNVLDEHNFDYLMRRAIQAVNRRARDSVERV